MAAESLIPGVRIRQMTAADVPEILDLERRLFPHDAWPQRFFNDELAQAEPNVAEHRATRRYWVVENVECEGRAGHAGLVGYAGMMCVLPLADVQTLAVAPEAQGKGLGAHLLGLIEQEARRRSAEDLLLEVRADNAPAQRLYLRSGFEKIHERWSYYPDGGDAWIMRKRLAAAKQSSAAHLNAPGPQGRFMAGADALSAQLERVRGADSPVSSAKGRVSGESTPLSGEAAGPGGGTHG